MKFVFAPIGIVAGLLAGMAAQKAFERLWAVIDDEEPPAPDNRDVSIPKLVAALLVEGAIFRLVKGLVDRGRRLARRARVGLAPDHQPRGRPAPDPRRDLDPMAGPPERRLDPNPA